MRKREMLKGDMRQMCDEIVQDYNVNNDDDMVVDNTEKN